MNIRICSFVAVMTLVSITSGCSGMKNFLFGRGARCGLCNSNSGGMPAPQFGNAMQAPCGGPQCGQPNMGQPFANQPYMGPQHGCGSEHYQPAPYNQGGYSCGTCGAPSGGDCGCSYSDPYMSGEVMGVPNGAVGYPAGVPTMAPIQTDDFSARKFDNDGNRIIWEEPSYGGTAL